MAIFDEYKQAVQDVLDGRAKEPSLPFAFSDEGDMLAALYAAAAALSLSKEAPGGGGGLPAVTSADNGKVMAVVDGEWESSLIPFDDEKIEQSVDAWLDDHPEATTTVEDGAITRAKLDADLQGKTDAAEKFEGISGIRNTFFSKALSGTITAQVGKDANLNWNIVGTDDYVAGVTKGYGAITFQIEEGTQISSGNVKAGSHYYCNRSLSEAEITALNNGEWVTISMTNGMTGGSDTKVAYNITFKFVDKTRVNKVNWRNPVGINLTEAFGEGNEPSRLSMDLLLSCFADKRPPLEYSALATSQAAAMPPRGLRGPVGESQFVETMPDGNVMISSHPFPGWSGWNEIGTYGQANVSTIPIYNKVHGTIETDGMVSVLPLWGCWSENASNTGSARDHHGAHVFHGWTTDRQHRLTMAQNIYSDDEASIFNYIPGDKSGTSGGIFLPLRLGTDSLNNGFSLVPVYVDGAGFAFRAKLTGIMNLDYKDGVFPKPASSSSPGTKGDVCFDSNYIYVCVANNSWKRVALESW